MQNVKLYLPPIERRGEEAYKTLRTNLLFCGKDVKTIAITSCTASEGKTTVSLNLAKSLAESGKRVLLIDADLRKSIMAARCRVTAPIRGLSHFLSGQNPLSEVVCVTDINNLHIIFSGPVPPNPAELLESENFKMTLLKLRTTYDYILVDTPPLGSVIDAAVAANECDGSVLVLSANAISYRFAKKVVEQLKKANCPVLGVIMNKVDMKNGTYGRYYGKYYSKYYGKYYGKEVDKYLEG